jgi:hypothetical protein
MRQPKINKHIAHWQAVRELPEDVPQVPPVPLDSEETRAALYAEVELSARAMEQQEPEEVEFFPDDLH